MVKKTVFRYFFDFLHGQEAWLNDMSAKGYRLYQCGRAAYVFEPCRPGEYEYAVEFVGTQSYAKAKQYREYLESMGFRTFTKNINLNISFGKIKWRPYAKGMGQVATFPGGYNQELIILEKKKDGRPFELHTDVGNQLSVYKEVRRAYVWAVLVAIVLMVFTFIPHINSMPQVMTWLVRGVLALIGVLFLNPALNYTAIVKQLTEESKLYE